MNCKSHMINYIGHVIPQRITWSHHYGHVTCWEWPEFKLCLPWWSNDLLVDWERAFKRGIVLTSWKAAGFPDGIWDMGAWILFNPPEEDVDDDPLRWEDSVPPWGNWKLCWNPCPDDVITSPPPVVMEFCIGLALLLLVLPKLKEDWGEVSDPPPPPPPLAAAAACNICCCCCCSCWMRAERCCNICNWWAVGIKPEDVENSWGAAWGYSNSLVHEIHF